MKALFITTPTNDCKNHVRAWNSFARSEHFIFEPNAIRNDWQALEKAQEVRPDVIFYIGPNRGQGVPRTSMFRSIREVAPFINIVSDAADKPWHRTLEFYRSRECFDLQVSIDGARDAPVDFATLTPVDPSPFGEEKTVRCGFSGSVSGAREAIVRSLEWFAGVQVRRPQGSYEDHARFMSRCEVILNVSFTGTGKSHHIKGRVLEAGCAGAALLEHHESPIGDWFPDDCYFLYRDPPDAARLIKTLPNDVVRHRANRLAEEVRTRFSPEKIYTEIISLVGHTLPVQAA